MILELLGKVVDILTRLSRVGLVSRATERWEIEMAARAEITEELKRAILSAGSTRQGANVTESGRCSGEAALALRAAGLIGAQGGLTRKGSILAEKLWRQAEDEAFGATGGAA